MSAKVDRAGERFGSLVVASAAANIGDKTAWLCVCDCGQSLVVRTGNLVTGNTQSCGCRLIDLGHARSGDQHPLWQEDVKYAAAHYRVQSARGRASDHPCADCQGPARDWSYEGGDPLERVEMVKGSPRRYSLDVSLYEPRCRSCHLSKDFRESRNR